MSLHSLSSTFFKIVSLKAEEEIMLKLLITALILLLTVSGVSPACGRAEYLTGQECCPTCGPGYCVWRDCTEYASTMCIPCLSGSYTEAPNGLKSCSSCTVCNSSAGLRVKRECTSTSDALCEPLEGHYCTDPIKDGCREVVQHTKCLPGKYIKQPGTAFSDAECDDCVGKTYSNGSFTSCRPHTQCELMGLEVLKEGSSSHDTECGRRPNSVGVIVGVIAGVIATATACGTGLFIYLKKKKRKRPNSAKTPGVNVPLRNTVAVQEENEVNGKGQQPCEQNSEDAWA
ncbi:hypothetical protein ACEWY4_000143 [Coilia grayii]|uniref:TNFR-Cys domain-containing protein n=1 Tax=Coilia grayii TaxID=363190 RepID=A0ABD1KVV9_9TELE